jgi:hypothetical protein
MGDKLEEIQELCSICYNEIKTETGKAVLSCQHFFHLKCISVWLSENNSCPCCRNAVSRDYEDLRRRDDLNERIQSDDADDINESEIEYESESDDNMNERGGAIMITLAGLRLLAQYYCEFCLRFQSREDQLVVELICREKISQDMFDQFCHGSIAAVHQVTMPHVSNSHFSHCFSSYSQTNMFFLGLFNKTEIITNSFWDFWERLRIRQNNVFQNDPNRNANFIREVMIDHRVILSSPQTSFLNFIIDPYTEQRLHRILASTAFVSNTDFFNNAFISNIEGGEEIIGV